MYTLTVSGTMLFDIPHANRHSYEKQEEAYDGATSFARRRHFYKSLVVLLEKEKEKIYMFEMSERVLKEEWLGKDHA
jgi:hypothetical protein